MIISGSLIAKQAFPDMSMGHTLSLAVGLHVIAAGYALALGRQT